MSERTGGFVVAIDGLAGSGKSTTARLCALRLGFDHLDTGAMYRAVTLKVIESGINPRNTRALARLLANTCVTVNWAQGQMRVLLDGRDVTQAVRTPEVSALVSQVSAIPAVRRKLVAEQRRFAQGRMVVCEGRDIGTVVFPQAQVKVFLVCDHKERSRRRQLELKQQGRKVSVASVRANLAARDRVDSRRRMSPLRRAKDAFLVDTTDLTIDEQVAVVCDLVRRQLGRGDQVKGQGAKRSRGDGTA
ncbi:MAG: (d)CMP kinase [candidate division WOR-3 bacterium]